MPQCPLTVKQLKKSRRKRFGVFIVHSSMGLPFYPKEQGEFEGNLYAVVAQARNLR
jgi:hypothetical protein